MMKILKNTILVSIFLSMTNFISASVVDDARKLMNEGDFESALSVVTEELKVKQKATVLSELNLLAGECCYNLNRIEDAIDYFNLAKSRKPEAYRYLGKIRFLDYDFDASEELYDSYYEQMSKSEKEIMPDVDLERDKLQKAQNMIERVEQIVIIDSLSVAKEGFFKFYRIAESSGRLKGMDKIPFSVDDVISGDMPYYTNENEEFVVYVQPDSVGALYLEESAYLIDGSWQEPIRISFGDDFNGDMAYPFMMSDGATLYFSNNGDESIGGYDIFRSNRDVETHEYMSPQNIGMPYNSPYNDYMLAIDEENGVGWWATDRNSPDSDKVTIYLFLSNDVRVNRNVDDPMIADYAKVADIKSTWEESADYSEILDIVNQIEPNKSKKKVEFNFVLRSGVVYQNYDDFKSNEGRDLMKLYVEKNLEFNQMMTELTDLRAEYKRSLSGTLVSEIKRYEELVQRLNDEIMKIKNKIYKIEK